MVVEDDLVGVGDVDEVAAGGVHDALGLAGGAGGVEDEEGIFGVHPLGGAVGAGLRHGVVIPDVLGAHLGLDLVAHALHDDDLLDGGAVLDGVVGVGLLGDGLGAAEGAVTGHEHFRGAVLEAVAEGVGAEPAEHDAVDGADAGAGQQAGCELGDHGQVEADPVALLHAESLQDVGELADFLVELLVGQGLVVAGLVALELDGDLVAAGLQVPVEAVVGYVELASLEELDVDRALLDVEVVVHDLVPLLEPLDILACDLRPECIGLFNGALPKLVVGRSPGNPGRLLQLLRNRIHIFQLYVCHLHSTSI